MTINCYTEMLSNIQGIMTVYNYWVFRLHNLMMAQVNSLEVQKIKAELNFHFT